MDFNQGMSALDEIKLFLVVHLRTNISIVAGHLSESCEDIELGHDG